MVVFVTLGDSVDAPVLLQSDIIKILAAMVPGVDVDQALLLPSPDHRRLPLLQTGLPVRTRIAPMRAFEGHVLVSDHLVVGAGNGDPEGMRLGEELYVGKQGCAGGKADAKRGNIEWMGKDGGPGQLIEVAGRGV